MGRLCDLLDGADSAVQGATLRTLLTVMCGDIDLSVIELAAVARVAQAHQTESDLGVAEPARQLLAAVAMPVAILAASGINIGGIQDEPSWRSQVRIVMCGVSPITPDALKRSLPYSWVHSHCCTP